MVRRLLALTLVLAACGGASSQSLEGVADLPVTDVAGFEAHLEALERPAVVNVWASWCLPCRSEAPLLDEAYTAFGDRIEFIGVDVQDSQNDAKAFLAEYGLNGFDHYFDSDRSIPNHYLGFGTPITFFFAPGGELIHTHNGVIDERTLALQIDELLNLEG
ncbi:MAG TPA: TlpA disulfide reductase family protein [Acidimicrobiia bacterium]|nr:TlpA disulfide reductase family protein [Acidimicrobiia bacterium]